MNSTLAVSIVADLLPIAESLFGLIEKIKTQAPDVWESVSGEYAAAASAWADAKAANAAHASNNAALVASLDKTAVSTSPPVEPAPVAVAATLVGTSSAQQAAAGAPLAHYG